MARIPVKRRESGRWKGLLLGLSIAFLLIVSVISVAVWQQREQPVTADIRILDGIAPSAQVVTPSDARHYDEYAWADSSEYAAN